MADSYFEREDRIRAAGLTMAQTFYLCTINRFMGKNDSAWPSHSAIAAAMNSTIRSVIRYQQELEDLGVLEVITGKGCKTSNEYRILFDKLPSNSDRISPFEPIGIVTDCHHIGDTVAPFTPIDEPGIVTNCHSNSDTVSPGIVTIWQTEELNRNTHEQYSGNSQVSPEPSREISGKAEHHLEAFVTTWNEWHSQGLVRTSIADFERRGKMLRAAWKRGWADSDQRTRLMNLGDLREAIVTSREFLKGARWFDAAALVGGKNGNRLWYAQQLLAGVYADKAVTRPGPNRVNQSPEVPAGLPDWRQAMEAIRGIDVLEAGYPEALRQKLGDRPARTLMKIGVRRIQDANDFQRREMAMEYTKELTSCR